jgi:NADH oxidoreductase Hcr
MTCGPAPYMDIVEEDVKALGVTRFFKEQFLRRWRKRRPAV